MSNLYNLVSGGIPGGMVLLIATLICINLAIIFFKQSGLLSVNAAKKTVTINAAILAFYFIFWIYSRPDPLPERIIILPTPTDSLVKLDAKSFFLADIFKKNNYSIDGRFLVHRWDWLLETLPEEKHSSYKEWLSLSRKLNPVILVESFWNGETLVVKAKREERDSEITAEISPDNIENDVTSLLKKLDLSLKKNRNITLPQLKYLDADLKIANGQMDLVLRELEDDTSLAANITKGSAYVYKGFLFKYNLEKMEFVKIVNPDFERAKAALYPILRSRKDSPEITYLLGRMAIREQDYESGEVFFKKTFSDELWNPRIYYYLSYLLSSRLEELGYNRRTILEKAVKLDPGFTSAVLDLAKEAYLAGTGAVEGYGTQYALQVLEDYLYLNPDNPDVLTLLATFYMKIDKPDQAEDIYKKLMAKYPKESNYVYDLGIVQYTRKKYPEALNLFRQAIKMDNNLDAYLYAGITAEMMGNMQEALKYYQDRVRYKTSEDDSYAREAMRGIRNVLEKMKKSKKDSSK